MITSIHYKNFKALQDATLPLGRFTLIVGANGTGKSTAIKALKDLEHINHGNLSGFLCKNSNIEKYAIDDIITASRYARASADILAPPAVEANPQNPPKVGNASGTDEFRPP